jgi:shikimate kinase
MLYCLSLLLNSKHSPAMRIFLIGFMGSGKTHWGQQLAARLQLSFFDLDEVIVQSMGKSISQVFAEEGEEFFRRTETRFLEELIEQHEAMVLSCGGGTPCYFNNIDLMKKAGTVVWLNTSIDTLSTRLIREKAKRPLLKDIDDEELKAYILKKMNDRRLYYEQATIHTEEDNISIDSLIQQILHA